MGGEGAQIAAPRPAPEVLAALRAAAASRVGPSRRAPSLAPGPAPCSSRQFAPFAGACRGLARPPPPAAPARAAPQGLLLSLLAILRRVVCPSPPPRTPLASQEQPNGRRSCLSQARHTLPALEASAPSFSLGAPQTPRPSLLPPPRLRVPRSETLFSLSPNLERDFSTRASQPAQAAERRRIRPGKSERRWRGGPGSQRLGGFDQSRAAGRFHAAFGGGLLEGGRDVSRQEVGEAQARGLARRSQGRPRGRMGARGGGAKGGAACKLRGGCEPRGGEPWGRGAWLLAAAVAVAVGGRRGAGRLLLLSQAQSQSERGKWFLVSRDYCALKVSQIIAGMQLCAPRKVSLHPTSLSWGLVEPRCCLSEAKGDFCRGRGCFLTAEAAGPPWLAKLGPVHRPPTPRS